MIGTSDTQVADTTTALLFSSGLAAQLAPVFYALPCVTASVGLPTAYLVLPWYWALICLPVSCLAWILSRTGPRRSSDWKLALLGLRLSKFRYAVIGLVTIYFAYERNWLLVLLTLATTPLCWIGRFLMLSGKMLEVEELEHDFCSKILASTGHSCDGKGLASSR
jgi:hypothetical protein